GTEAVRDLELRHHTRQVGAAEDLQQARLHLALGWPPIRIPFLEHRSDRTDAAQPSTGVTFEPLGHRFEGDQAVAARRLHNALDVARGRLQTRELEHDALGAHDWDPVDLGDVRRDNPSALVHDDTVTPRAEPACAGDFDVRAVTTRQAIE